MRALLEKVGPDEVYHLAAQSHVRVSFDEPEYTGDVTGLGTTRILEAIRAAQVPVKFYQASSSEMFGSTPPPQSESSPLQPQDAYGQSQGLAANTDPYYDYAVQRGQAELRQAAAAAAQDLGGFNTVFQEFAAKQRAMQDAAKRRKVDDFIRWLAVHQDDEVTA